MRFAPVIASEILPRVRPGVELPGQNTGFRESVKELMEAVACSPLEPGHTAYLPDAVLCRW